MDFLQQDYLLISGGPEEKRRFLDLSCSLLVPGYYNTLLKYNRALKQRNLQIKHDLENSTNHRHLWNDILAKTGIFLMQVRCSLVEKLLEMARLRISQMVQTPIDLHIDYVPSVRRTDTESGFDAFVEKLKETQRREDIFRSTIVGPHRDGLHFLNSGEDMRAFSSQGQIRMAVLSMKLAVIDLMRIDQNAYPVLMFDDAFIEIDKRNTQMILDSLKDYN